MRNMIAPALCAMLALAPAALTPVSAQTQPGAPAQGSESPRPSPGVRSVKVVDVEELPANTKAQVTQNAARQKESDLAALRQSIDAAPQITSALQAKGATSAQVIAASLDDEGVLTLVTRKRSG